MRRFLSRTEKKLPLESSPFSAASIRIIGRNRSTGDERQRRAIEVGDRRHLTTSRVRVDSTSTSTLVTAFNAEAASRRGSCPSGWRQRRRADSRKRWINSVCMAGRLDSSDRRRTSHHATPRPPAPAATSGDVDVDDGRRVEKLVRIATTAGARD